MSVLCANQVFDLKSESCAACVSNEWKVFWNRNVDFVKQLDAFFVFAQSNDVVVKH